MPTADNICCLVDRISGSQLPEVATLKLFEYDKALSFVFLIQQVVESRLKQKTSYLAWIRWLSYTSLNPVRCKVSSSNIELGNDINTRIQEYNKS